MHQPKPILITETKEFVFANGFKVVWHREEQSGRNHFIPGGCPYLVSVHLLIGESYQQIAQPVKVNKTPSILYSNTVVKNLSKPKI